MAIYLVDMHDRASADSSSVRLARLMCVLNKREVEKMEDGTKTTQEEASVQLTLAQANLANAQAESIRFQTELHASMSRREHRAAQTGVGLAGAPIRFPGD